MKTYLFIILNILMIFSCSQDKELIQGDWIEKYDYTESIDNFSICKKRIFSFHKDSIFVYDFHFDFNYGGERIKRGTFRFEKENLIFRFEGSSDTAKFKFNKLGQFEIQSENGYLNYVFERLEKFKAKPRIEEFQNVLTESVFKYSIDTISFDFTKDKRYVIDAISRDMAGPLIWKIETFKDEVFLVYPNALGPALQLKSIKKDTLDFRFYTKKNIDFYFHKAIPKLVIAHNQLIGTWEKVKSWEYDSEETIKFSNIDVIKTSGTRKETQNWRISKIGNVIAFDEAFKGEEKARWNIERVTKNELIIFRNLKYPRFEEEIERVTFKRK